MKKFYWLALLLVIFLFLFFALAVSGWWFHTADDFSAIVYGFHGPSSWWQIAKFCFLKTINHYMDLSVGSCELNFWKTFFRPASCLFYVLSYKIFGIEAYCYFLLNVFVHLANVFLLFFLLNLVVDRVMALMISLLFAVHPLIGYLIGPISYFQHFFALFLLLINFFIYRRFLLTKRIGLYVISLFLFLISVFFRESTIYIPLIVFWGTRLFAQKSWQKTCVLAGGFVGIVVFYLLSKAVVCPFSLCVGSIEISLKQQLLLKFFDTIKIIKDLFWLSWVPDQSRVLNGSIVIVGLGFLLYLFIKNIEKKKILFCICGMCFALWPLIKMNYYSRYMIEAFPFWLLAMAFFIQPYQKYLLRRSFFLISYFLFMGFLLFLTANNLKIRSQNLMGLKGAVLAFVANLHETNPENKPISIVGLPYNGFVSGIEHAIEVFSHSCGPRIIFDPRTVIVQPNEHLYRTRLFFKESSPLPKLNFYFIEKQDDCLILKTKNSDKVSFYDIDKNNQSRDTRGRVVCVKLSKRNAQMLFYAFDYEHNKIVPLSSL